MKEKHKILLELEEQKELRQELTAELQHANAELEKERSKNAANASGNGGKKGEKGKVNIRLYLLLVFVKYFESDLSLSYFIFLQKNK